MKKLLCIFLSVLIFATSITVFANTTAPVVSVVCVDSINAEETFDVYVAITENSGVGGGRVTIGYDNNVLEVISIAKESLLASARLESNASYADSSLRVSWFSVTNLSSGGNLFKITFKAKAIYSDVFATMTIEDIKLTDADANVILGTSTNTNLEVKAKNVPTFSVECKNEVSNGENFDVCINITDNSLACGGKFNLIYDNSKFEIVSTEFGNILSNSAPFVNNNDEKPIKANWAGTIPLTNGGCLLKATFKVLDNIGGSGDFILQNCKVTDNNDTTVQCLANNKTVKINCSTETKYYKENGKLKFSSSIKGCPESAILFVVLYTTDGRMVDFKQTAISNESSKDMYFDKCSFDKVKIFVWESSKTLKPISDVEVLPYE